MSRLSIRIVLVIMGLLLMAGFVFLYVFRKAPDDLNKAKPAFQVEATELFQAFEDDENAAMAKFGGKVIELTGELMSIKPDEWGQTILVFMDPLFGVTAIIDSLGTKMQAAEIDQLKTGDQVRVKARCDGMLTDVRLSKCLIIPKK